MANFEARIKTKVGEISISFDTKEELAKRLAEVQSFLPIIESQKFAILQEERKVIPGLESLYAIGSDGLPRLKKVPKNKSDLVKLALFLSEEPLTLAQVTKITGVKNPLSAVHQKGLSKIADGRYTLDADSRSDVSTKVIPALTKVEKGDAGG